MSAPTPSAPFVPLPDSQARTRSCNNVLLVSEQPTEDDFLLAANGEPVWPVRSQADYEMLQGVAGVCGAKLERVRGHIERATGGAEEVLAFEEELFPLAELYAHLTGRSVRLSKSSDTLREDLPPSVVVTEPGRLTSEFLDSLYSCRDLPAPGIICASNAAALRQQVLARSAAGALCGPTHTHRVDLYPLISMSESGVADWKILGKEASIIAIREALGLGAGVLTILTHSDGVDVYLSSNLHLCAMLRPLPNAVPNLGPTCQATGICHRQSKPLVEALQSEGVISTDAICTKVMVLNTCSGLLPPDGVVDPLWGLGYQLLENPQIGAIVTRWKISFTSHAEINVLTDAIAAGLPIGEAVARFHRSLPPDSVAGRLCLLGDPRVRLSVKTDVECLTSNGRVPGSLQADPPEARPPAAIELNHLSKLSFLRACIRQAISGENAEPPEAALQALKAIDGYEAATWQGLPLEGAAGLPGPLMRQAFLRYFFAHCKLLNDWTHFAQMSESSASGKPCFVCHKRTATFEGRFHGVQGVVPRRVTTCPRCGIIEDVPANWDISLAIHASTRTIHLSGKLHGHTCIARAVSCFGRSCRRFDWPAYGQSTPPVICLILTSLTGIGRRGRSSLT